MQKNYENSVVEADMHRKSKHSCGCTVCSFNVIVKPGAMHFIPQILLLQVCFPI